MVSLTNARRRCCLYDWELSWVTVPFSVCSHDLSHLHQTVVQWSFSCSPTLGCFCTEITGSWVSRPTIDLEILSASKHPLTVFHDFVQARLFSSNEVWSMWALNCKWGLCWYWRKWSCRSRRGRIWAWLSMWQFLIHCFFFLFPHFEQHSNYFWFGGASPMVLGPLELYLAVLERADGDRIEQDSSRHALCPFSYLLVWCLKIVLLTCWLCPVSHFKAKCFFRSDLGL